MLERTNPEAAHLRCARVIQLDEESADSGVLLCVDEAALQPPQAIFVAHGCQFGSFSRLPSSTLICCFGRAFAHLCQELHRVKREALIIGIVDQLAVVASIGKSGPMPTFSIRQSAKFEAY
jgi:hypothetical protein